MSLPRRGFRRTAGTVAATSTRFTDSWARWPGPGRSEARLRAVVGEGLEGRDELEVGGRPARRSARGGRGGAVPGWAAGTPPVLPGLRVSPWPGGPGWNSEDPGACHRRPAGAGRPVTRGADWSHGVAGDGPNRSACRHTAVGVAPSEEEYGRRTVRRPQRPPPHRPPARQYDVGAARNRF